MTAAVRITFGLAPKIGFGLLGKFWIFALNPASLRPEIGFQRRYIIIFHDVLELLIGCPLGISVVLCIALVLLIDLTEDYHKDGNVGYRADGHHYHCGSHLLGRLGWS
jgi:hypothetical protein